MKSRQLSVFAILVIGSITLTGCPELQPPFDSTGSYSGAFNLGFSDFELFNGCNLQMTLDQNIGGLPLLNAGVNGYVTLSLDCVLPEELVALTGGNLSLFTGALAALGTGEIASGLTGLLAIPPVAVTGVLLPDGTLELNTPEMLQDCAEGNCTKLVMAGKGRDTDEDGKMDRYSGTFAGLLGFSLGNLPIVGNFELYTGN
jgi:hypothetical protein